MAIFPVVLCGGSGTRLWPASRPERPKQFIDLIGDHSLFQDTIRRVAPLAQDGGRVIVIAGQHHAGFVKDQLAALGIDTLTLLEPGGRDSAPAMAMAAEVIKTFDPDGLALFVASDHHIPDAQAFRASVAAAASAAQSGRIVTFGVRPTDPSSAYGYIRPAGEGLAAVEKFVEKPDPTTARAYLLDGYLWNSGNFLAGARILSREIATHAPAIAEAVRLALPSNLNSDIVVLPDDFLAAPKISIDYAVMEVSDRVSVLPVDYEWSDLGAWDAVAAVGLGERGVWIGDKDETSFIRAAPGMVVATAGVAGLAIVAEPDAVLVCSLDRAQEVKGLVDRLADMKRAASASVIRRPGPTRRQFEDWMKLSALPLWATLGVDEDGGFREAVSASGEATADFRRARVQARQVFVYATAARLGWSGPWRSLVTRALDRFEQTNRRPDGLYRTRVDREGRVLDDTAHLYDQAFVLLALAAAAHAGLDPEAMSTRAHGLRRALDTLRIERGWREEGDHPYQANAHMHLLEAFLAWEAVEPKGPWAALADQVVDLALEAFIDADGGFLREFFDQDWRPAPGDDGRLVEPGHQFEWAWLLSRWGRSRGRSDALDAAARLYQVGLRGVDAERGVAVDELDAADLSVRSSRARLWPQTERLKAALVLGAEVEAEQALTGLWRYLEPSGLWRDKMDPDGALDTDPAPASSLYHIVSAWDQLSASAS